MDSNDSEFADPAGPREDPEPSGPAGSSGAPRSPGPPRPSGFSGPPGRPAAPGSAAGSTPHSTEPFGHCAPSPPAGSPGTPAAQRDSSPPSPSASRSAHSAQPGRPGRPGQPDWSGARVAPPARLSGARFESDPAGLYAGLRRRHGGVAPVLLEGGVPAWLVIGYRELHYVASCPWLFARDARRWNAWDRVPADWPLLPMIGYEHPSVLCAEGEAHRRRAAMISDALDGVDPYELRAESDRIADHLVDAFCAAGRADLIAQYAHPLPLLVLARFLGIDEARGAGGHDLADAVRAMVTGSEDAALARLHLYRALRRVPAARRENPGPDVATRMVRHPEAYPDEELTQDLMVLLAAGHQPTADWIGNTLRLMLADDRFAASPTGGRRGIGQAMTEVLWRDTPVQNFAGRYATRDVSLDGHRVTAGDLLILGLAAANADPSVRPPGCRGPAEDSRAYLSFGHGEHRCPYPAQDIATIIARAGVEVLLHRLPDIRLSVPADGLTWRRSPWLRGLTALPVAFAPVAPSR